MEKEFNLSEKMFRLGGFIVFQKEHVKEFIKKRNDELKKIELCLTSDDTDQFDIALGRVRDLINDRNQFVKAGGKLLE